VRSSEAFGQSWRFLVFFFFFVVAVCILRKGGGVGNGQSIYQTSSAIYDVLCLAQKKFFVVAVAILTYKTIFHL
jgi:hypothetical protein